MGLANCKRCSKLYVKVSRDICDDCFKKEEDDLLSVQRYLRDHPKASMEEVLEANEVEEIMVRKWVREKRLMLSFSVGGAVECEVCGTPIMDGRLCASCQLKFVAGRPASGSEEQTSKDSTSLPRRSTSRREDSGGDSMIADKFKR